MYITHIVLLTPKQNTNSGSQSWMPLKRKRYSELMPVVRRAGETAQGRA